MDIISRLMVNWERFMKENQDVKEAIKDGYEVAVYDEETGLIMTQELIGKDLKVKIIEEAHIIKKV